MTPPFPNSEYPHNEKLSAIYQSLTLEYWQHEIGHRKRKGKSTATDALPAKSLRQEKKSLSNAVGGAACEEPSAK